MSNPQQDYAKFRKLVVDDINASITARMRGARTTILRTVTGNGGSGGGGTVDFSDVTGVLPWARVDKTGATLLDIPSRAHSQLSSLTADDHPNYVSTVNARNISARHQFNPPTPNSPFTLGANADGQLVGGLNAEYVGGELESVFMRKSANSNLDMNSFGILSDDGDTTHFLGRAAIGDMGFSDLAGFAHRDHANATDCALLQNAAGGTFLGAASGREITLRIDGVDKAAINGSDQFLITSPVGIGSDNYASQTTGWWATYAGAGDFRYLYADEMHVKSFIADLEQALAGGQIIPYSVAELESAITIPAYSGTATLRVKSFPGFPNAYVFRVGDTVAIRIFNRTAGTSTVGGELQVAFAFGTVSAPSIDTTNKRQSWTFTRLAATTINGVAAGGTASAGTVVEAGPIVLDFGVSGNGYYEVSSVDGFLGANSPYAQVVTWAAHPWYDRTVRTRMGNLTGVGFTNEYGIYAQGATTGNYIKASDAGILLRSVDLAIFNGAARTVDLDHAAGNLLLGTDVAAGSTTTLAFTGTTGTLRVGPLGTNLPNLFWDGSELNLRINTAKKITLDSSGGSYFSGVMTIGASGEIRQGTGTPGTNFSGFRLRNASGIGEVTLNDGGAAPAVLMDFSGINIQGDDTPDNTISRNITWWDDIAVRTGNPIGRMRVRHNGIFFSQDLVIDARGSTGTYANANVVLGATNAAGTLTGGLTVSSNGHIISSASDLWIPEIRAYGPAGLKLLDDGGNLGLFVEDGGQVGVNTAAPLSRFHVDGDAASCYIRAGAHGTAIEPGLVLYSTRGTAASPTANQAGDSLGSIIFEGWDTDRTWGARIQAVAAADWGTAGDSSDAPTDLRFSTVPDGSGTTVERLAITSAGNVGVGTTTTPLSSAWGSTPVVTVAGSLQAVLELAGNRTSGASGIGVIGFLNEGIGGGDDRIGQLDCIRDGANNSGAFRIVTWNAGTAGVKMFIGSSGNIGINTSTAFGSGVGVLGILNAATNPTTNPSGGGVLYVNAGALTYRGSSGTVTVLAVA